ncbi:ATP/maltotriose-dependent transcriptional regulator MalT [Kribbella amoyensis]|uniref:ATP/maltotriose-dependent transcriptional regulator MalT n=1 Tax=Kribbella amoyensis TaxID=996641 RepID=A0A561BS69_9ACTN|nr:helix-turn-helix transcriptional regulator [Kribbella amoyensis]TWD81738.1 ATP/maltotriose-dependent transcriptional regulator MalT [Kribbella amoyensis]
METRGDPSVWGGPGRLRGRRTECAVLDETVAAVRAGAGRSLVLRGDAGVGKTALLEYAVHGATGLRVLHAVGVESEMELAFSALHQLCTPMLDRLDRLPDPQRDALGTVFGLSNGGPPDRFLVGLAVLSLLSELAADGPLVCVVDDAQWLDRASAQVLGVVARRLVVEPVGMLFGTRRPTAELHALPELEITGLRIGDARALLDSAVRFVLDERVRDRIVAETGGNPLALLELPRGLTVAQLAGGFGLPGTQELPRRIESSFLARIGELPEQTRLLLLIAAAESVGDPLLVRRAAERLGVGPEAVTGAETEGLLAIGERVTFRHPLVRSAVYRAASAQDRRAAHLALAEVTDAKADPDRRVWHLAAAAPGPDEHVAAALERSSGRAQARGGLAAAAAFLQRSVALTDDFARRADRALGAAQVSLLAGEFDSALGLLATAEVGVLDEYQRARTNLLRGQIAFASGHGSDAPPLLLKAAKQWELLDLDLARETYLDAWGAALFAGRLATAGSLREASRAALALPRAESPRPSDLLLEGLATLVMAGRAAAAPILRRATGAFAARDVSIEDNFRWGWLTTVPSNVLWDDGAWHGINVRQLRLARRSGALARLPIDLTAHAILVAWRGDFPEAEAAIAEIHAVVDATETRIAPYAAMLLAAMKGRPAEATPLITAAAKDAAAGGQGIGVQYGQWVSAILANGLGRYDEALTAAEQASQETPELFLSAWALPELVEAAVRSGKPHVAAAGLERLQEATSAAGTDWALGVEARSRALVGEGKVAEQSYRDAIERLERTLIGPELARAHLLYGEWLRRQSRRVDARGQLRTAHEMLTSIGMEAFAERARRELLSTGETVRKRSAGATRDELTPQEKQIALLARDGLSNPEVGARLFLSPRTVEWHLRKIFTKLAISSRKDLRDALRSAGD